MADLRNVPMGEGGSPQGPGKVKGPLKMDLSSMATHLRKKPIAIAAAAMLLGVVGIGYTAVKIFPEFDTSKTQSVSLASGAPDIQPVHRIAPPKQKEVKATAPVASAQSSASTPPKIAPVPLQTAPAPAPQNTQPSPQMTAFQAAISGGFGGGSNGGWSQTTAPTQSAPNAVNPLTLAKSIAEMTGKQGKQQNVYNTHLVRKEVSPYELLQGSVIPALLTTGIKSDISGQVTAVVDHPVYNSLNGAYVLIPAGSKLIGVYKSGAAMGQNRVGVMWTRIEFPNGTYMQLGKMGGTSPRGYAGFRDEVNDHSWEIFKNALLLSFIDIGMSIASPTSTSTNTTGVTGNEALQDGEQSLAQTFGQAEAQMFQKYISVAPTLTIRPGYAFNVVVTKDLVFPGPYQHGVNYTQTQNPGQPAPASEINPYGG